MNTAGTPGSTHPTITIDLVSSLVLESVPSSQIQILDRHTTKDVLRAVLHSILFHRLFGTVKPRTFEVLDVTMVRRAPLVPDCL